MYKNSFVHYLTKILVDVMFYGGTICCVAVPFLVPKLVEVSNYETRNVTPFIIVLLLLGLSSIYILWQLKIIFKTLIGGNPFVDSNVNCLRKMAIASFIITIIFIVDFFKVLSLASLFSFVLFGLLGLFCLTLKDVFKQAIAYKEENDWTV